MKNHLNRSILIGIDGLGGAGKTTVASVLQKRFKDSIILHLDDFIYSKETRYKDDFDEWYSYYHLQWRYDYLIQKLLLPIRSGLHTKEAIEIYDKKTDSYRNEVIEVPVASIVFVEGVFLQRPEIRNYFDYVIFIHKPKIERLKRVLERDSYIGNKSEIAKKYKQRYFPAEQYYIEQCNPKKLANIILKE